MAVDGDVCGVCWLGPLCVVGAFGWPFDCCAFDDAGVGAQSAGGVDSARESGGGELPELGYRGVVMRGKKNCGTTIFG